jgi:hypothetical protein
VKEFGLHATEGPRVWQVYRAFEMSLVQPLLERESNNQPVATGTDEEQEGNIDDNVSLIEQQQVERVRALFKRQICLPLAGRQDLLDEYR